MKRALILALLAFTTPASAAVDNDPSAAACTVKGKQSIQEPLFAGATGGTPLLTLSGHEREIEAYELPGDAHTGRIRVRAKRNVPGIRVDGYIPGKNVTFSATKDQVVITDHVWIRAGAYLRVFQSATSLDAEPMHSPIGNVRTRLACSELRFGLSASPATTKANGWFYFKQKSTPLLDGPGGKPVFTVSLLVDRTSLRVASLKTQGTFHEIEIFDDVKVSGWVRAVDLEPEKAGDYGAIGGLGLTGVGTSGSSAPVRIAKQDVEIYLAPNSAGQSVGVLEKGARVWAAPVTNGFSTITFVERDAVPPDGKQFHVLTSAVQ